jgi:spore coat protein H
MTSRLLLGRFLTGLLFISALSACSDDKPIRPGGSDSEEPQGEDPAPSFDLYPRSALLEVEISLPAEAWRVLKNEGLTINGVFTGCDRSAYDYTKFEAKVRVGEHTFARAGVRKKGYVGSISNVRPSLRIDLDEYLPEQALGGSHAITLNNSLSDRSYAAQCLSYAQFAAAGIPAPRCGFAHVTVNGESLGVYVSVEPVKKPFLRDHFGNDDGDLYEGSGGADFRDDMLDAFEKKTNEDQPQGPELKKLADALTLPDAKLVAALEEILDLDEYLRFWAMETLVAHWDGYAGDLNNFFVYADASDGKLHFIPWGTDTAYEQEHPFLPDAGWPRSAFAWARLPRRLYALAETRARYRETLRQLLQQHWDEKALLAEIDQIAEVASEDVAAPAVEALRAFVRGRRAELLAELDAPAKDWTVAERDVAQCRPETSTPLRVTFNTTWGDLAATSAVADNTITGTVFGKPLAPIYVIASAGVSLDPAAPGKALRITVGNLDGTFTLFQFMLGTPTLAAGELPLHGFETFGIALTGRPTSDGSVPAVQTIGYVGNGRIVFEAVGTGSGDKVSGRIEAEFVTLGATPMTAP